MPRFHITVAASRDINSIADYIAADRQSAAVAWLTNVYRLFDTLAGQPNAGQRIETRLHGRVRLLSHGSYVVYFRPASDGVEILRVIHGARDHEKLV